MLTRVRRRPRDERGAVMVLFSLLLVTLLGLSAFAVDLGYDRQVVAHLQSGVDAGALAGARELPKGAADATKAAKARTVAANFAVQGLFDGPAPALGTPACSGNTCTYTIQTVTLTITSPYTPPAGLSSGLGSQNLIYVQACQPGGNFFRKFISTTGSTLCRSSVARHVSSPSGFQFGLVTLDPHSCASMQFAGNSDTVLSSNGGVAVNSDCSDSGTGAMDSSGSSWGLHASFIGVVGTATLAPCAPPSACTSTIPTQGITPFADPLALSTPAKPTPYPLSLACPANNPDVQLILPGYYADNCSFGSNNTYIFFPGLYYFAQGFSTGGNADLICSAISLAVAPPAPVTLASPCGQPTWNTDGTPNNVGGVTFYVPPGTGDIKMNGTGKVKLPGSAYYKGVAIFQASCNSSIINGTASFTLGTVYAPCAPLTFTGSAGSQEINVNGMVIANRVSISGTFEFNINVPGSSPVINVGEDNGLEY